MRKISLKGVGSFMSNPVHFAVVLLTRQNKNRTECFEKVSIGLVLLYCSEASIKETKASTILGDLDTTCVLILERNPF
jgi:hypothetical protein